MITIVADGSCSSWRRPRTGTQDHCPTRSSYGITDIFIDHHSIAGGDKWREKLRESTGACRVIICLVTANWLASDECFGEFVAANYIHGKRIIPLFLLPAELELEEIARKRL